MTFRTRIFAGVFGASAVAVGVTVVLFSIWMRNALIGDAEADLRRQAGLAAQLLARRGLAAADSAAEADALADLLGMRVTLVAADGGVLGDSDVPPGQIADLENHNAHAEIAAARAAGSGVAVRHSRTTGLQTMYAAATVSAGPVSAVRVAVPLTRVQERLDFVRPVAFIGLATGLVAALLLTWAASIVLSRRIRAVADAAERLRAGDFSVTQADRERDEIGLIAGTLHQTARELGSRLEQVARERSHTQAMLAGMADGVVLVDDAGRLVLTNAAVQPMLRLPDGPEGRHFTEVVRHPDITSQITAVLAGGSSAPVEVQLHPDSRRRFVANVVAVPADRGGGAVLVLHDITDVWRAERVRRDFVANVSHELRTPLTAIRGAIEALGDEPAAEDAKRFLGIVGRHAAHMERLVRDLLRLARLDAGQERLERVDGRLADIVHAAGDDLRGIWAGRGQRLDVRIAPEAALVRGDAAKLHDVFRNLIENASRYSPEGSAVEIDARRAGAEVEITVADRGPGIPEADLERVFERFYRVDRSRARDPGGTGLGLAIVRHLVELHDGSVRAARRPGGGTEIIVRLPAGGGTDPAGAA